MIERTIFGVPLTDVILLAQAVASGAMGLAAGAQTLVRSL
jgi:hypothetical protein